MAPARPVSWRRATAADQAFLQGLYAAGRAAELAPLGWDEAARKAFCDMQYGFQQRAYRAAHPDAECRIVEVGVDGAALPVGRLWLDRSGPRWHLLDISLLPPWRAAGIGSALLQCLQEEAAAAPCRDLHLQVAIDNPARRLYARLGFAAVGVQGLHLEMHWSAAQAQPTLLESQHEQA